VMDNLYNSDLIIDREWDDYWSEPYKYIPTILDLNSEDGVCGANYLEWVAEHNYDPDDFWNGDEY